MSTRSPVTYSKVSQRKQHTVKSLACFYRFFHQHFLKVFIVYSFLAFCKQTPLLFLLLLAWRLPILYVLVCFCPLFFSLIRLVIQLVFLPIEFRASPTPSPYATALLPMSDQIAETIYSKPESVCPSRISYYASSQLTQVSFLTA